MLQLVSKPDDANDETTPETLKLNIRGLQKARNHPQYIETSMLLVRQTLAGKGVLATELETVLRGANKQPNDILSDPSVSIHHIGYWLSELCLPYWEKEPYYRLSQPEVCTWSRDESTQ
jgi:hypothetical protein